LQYICPVANGGTVCKPPNFWRSTQNKTNKYSNYTHTNIRTLTNCPINCPLHPPISITPNNLNVVPHLVPFHLVLPLHPPALKITPLAPLLASVRPLSLPAGKPERAALLCDTAPVSIRLSFQRLLLVHRLLVTAVDWRWEPVLEDSGAGSGFWLVSLLLSSRVFWAGLEIELEDGFWCAGTS